MFRSMVNYEYLKYWLQTMEYLDLQNKILLENIITYLRTQDMEYLEYISENTKEIRNLMIRKQEYYEKIFSPEN